MSHRIERFSSTLKQRLADILLNDAGNPHLKFVVITDIVVNPDLKKARVFITIPGADSGGSDDAIDAVIRQLDHAKGYIKKILAQKMYLRYVPELVFVPTPIIDAFDAADAGDNFSPGIPGSDDTLK
ncbi:MAG: 30S ribosome-binding factor RbfA [Candidatus Aminicenantes bacterium]|nr:30S ribosome-binding factor RbfA [Candidatus Aminicenantes bacterium]